MKTALYITFAFLISIPAFAQIDNNTGFGTPINAEESNDSFNEPLRTNAPRSLSNNNSFLNTKEDKPKPLSTEEEKEFNMTTDHGLMTRTFDYKPKWLSETSIIKKKEYEEGLKLGTVNTSSKYIEVLVRDHLKVDGDRVRVYLNDDVISNSLELRGDFQKIIIELSEGQNIIELQALNQGTAGANTAHFRVIDDNNTLLMESEWFLMTGDKGTLVVIRGE